MDLLTHQVKPPTMRLNEETANCFGCGDPTILCNAGLSRVHGPMHRLTSSRHEARVSSQCRSARPICAAQRGAGAVGRPRDKLHQLTSSHRMPCASVQYIASRSTTATCAATCGAGAAATSSRTAGARRRLTPAARCPRPRCDSSPGCHCHWPGRCLRDNFISSTTPADWTVVTA